jgi:O-antigen/teichoic acid export membrane protein
MSQVRKIFKNLLINFSSAIVVSLLSLAFTVIIARYLGSSGYGMFSYSLAYIAILTAFNDFGFTTAAVREIAKDPSNSQKYFSSVFTLRVILSMIVFLIALVVVPILRNDPLQIKILLLFTCAGAISMFQLSYRWIFQAHQAFEYDALLNIVQGIVSLALILLVIYFKKGLVVIAGVWILLHLIVTAVGLMSAHRMVKFRFAFDKELLKNMLPSALVIGSIAVVSILYLYIDKLILFQMKNSQEVGLYSAASKIMLFIRGLVFLYMPVAFPAFSSFSVNMGDRYFHKFLTRSFYYILIFTSAVALGGTLLSSQLMNLIFGSGYSDAVSALKIVMWALPLTCLSGLFSVSFIGIGRNKESLYVWIAGLLTNVVINVCFIGTYGYYATSVAVVTAELVMFTGFAVFAYKILEFNISIVKLSQIAFSLLAMGLFLIKAPSANLLFNIILGGLLYFVALLVFRAVDKDDWALLRKIFLKQI